jgi:hypothetical protein
MNKRIVVIAGIVLFALLLGIVAFQVLQSQLLSPARNRTALLPQNSRTVTDPATGALVTENSYVGKIKSLSDQPVGYKNSTVLTLETDKGAVQFYVTGDTVFRLLKNDPKKPPKKLSPGDQVQIRGIAAEGGVEALEVFVLQQ